MKSIHHSVSAFDSPRTHSAETCNLKSCSLLAGCFTSKLAKFSKTTYKTVKLKNGNKKRKRIKGKIESDWQTYYGSNDALLKDVAELGTHNFRRDILYYCKSKAECSYVEAREQFSRRVLESDQYYNGHIQVRVHGSHIKGKQLNG